ncbi:hypothetical protein NSK_006082 [Nannochloropsis salina CCMP1776]|jgi:ribosomal protein S18 acetylase RimI-like enzyme|uniref:N-acetyltransferase domain-containing protein n=1 Tax=Nannochloropsis salina CCMP1776 TaxID=1027361 RepID=A0A4D9D1X5_9STRA|nr:hypothetical protein NSK_006082 [Nannochloropsis salina CCMP1776]|eukprot:TFJ82658.1 hypothetical protein NSK_006082 [Nannochloropsis salina CCMP1776]
MHITFTSINATNLTELRLLNDTTFPVRYNDKFYAEVLTTLPDFTKYACIQNEVVGAICCRLEEGIESVEGQSDHRTRSLVSSLQKDRPQDVQKHSKGTDTKDNALSTENILAADDIHGRQVVDISSTPRDQQFKLYIMTLGVQAAHRGRGIGSQLLTSVLQATRRPPHANRIREIYLHVQTSNADAIHFYSKFGFETRSRIQNYYKRIEPPDCFVLSLLMDGGKQKHTRETGGASSEEGGRGHPTSSSSPLATLADLATTASSAEVHAIERSKGLD